MDKYGDEVLKLSNQICFPLYASGKEIVRKYQPYLEKLDLTYTQYIVLMVLWEKDHLSVKEIGAKLYLDSGTLTPLINKLIKKGYIQKEKSPVDERELIISLTSDGIKLKEKAKEIPPLIAKKVKLTQKEARTLYTLLYKLLDGFENE
ncbi:MAG: MarR family transcriptional regulator [Bacilli bacterium]|nr:MarR family transcriptional regulator [Bacilli bacterium]